MSRRTFLVTGATGDTGGATVEQMLARGHHVRALAHRQDDRAVSRTPKGAVLSGPTGVLLQMSHQTDSECSKGDKQ